MLLGTLWLWRHRVASCMVFEYVTEVSSVLLVGKRGGFATYA
jgi:hypothetical protein